MAGTVTGKNANIWIAAHSGQGTIDFSNGDHGTYALSDFSLTFDRGTVEQSLLGQAGNYFDQGPLSLTGSLTQCRFGISGNAPLLQNIVNGEDEFEYIAISGNVSDDASGITYLKWYLVSCQVTGYSFTFGDASTITEASIDFTLLDPQHLTYSNGLISDS